MPLNKYRSKRNFDETPEPQGGKPDSEKLRFVVQKHQASHLHYDFRLELDGVLKSWAVPKGPSTDPAIKRLAMMVEDHPYDYRNFEGVIPSGYGAGTVMIWDEGFYVATDNAGDDKRKNNAALKKALAAGKLKIKLSGKKLKGEYALIKAAQRGENAWLLFKLADKYASTTDITAKDRSVVSKRSLSQIARANNTHLEKKTAEKASIVKTKSKALKRTGQGEETTQKIKEKKKYPKKTNTPYDNLLASASRSAFPERLTPMLATLINKPFNEKGWLYEIKWDGYRTLIFCQKGKTSLLSRNQKSFNEKFYPIQRAFEALNLDVVADGEIVVLDKNGRADFGALQNWRSDADGTICIYLFDLLWIAGRNIMPLPLRQRQQILQMAIPFNDQIKLSEHFETDGIQFFQSVKKMGLEGIMAKHEDSVYMPGIRTDQWLKIKANQRQEMVIGGYTINEDTPKAFSSLLLGVYEENKLKYTGKVGTGFSDEQQRELLKLFKPLTRKKSPFTLIPDINKASRFNPSPAHATAVWLKPVLICEVSYTEMTKDGVMRHPSFEGMRDDKKVWEVVHEKKADTGKLIAKMKKKKALLKAPDEQAATTFLNPTDDTQVRKIGKQNLKFTHLSKLYWPEDGVSKRDMVIYYYRVAPYILPYLKNRPQSLNRFPEGIHGFSFYQKDVTGKVPDWIHTWLYHSEGDASDKHFLVADDAASLLYMASLGCIEMNPWSSTIKKPDHPDFCIIDLDPGNNTFDQVIEAAQICHQLLDDMHIANYAKTSGNTGIHVYIPLGAKYPYAVSKEFARVVATLLHHELPEYTSIERIVKNRKGKMYIDFLQNRPHATIAAPYSLRPKPGATVSMPLHWTEVKKGLKMKDFNIYNAMDRIESLGDIFKPVLGKGVDLQKILKGFADKK